MDRMFTGNDPYEPARTVRTAIPDRQKATRATVVPYLVGVAGVALAAVTLAMFLLWKGSAETQISQLQQEVATAQQAQATTEGTVTGLSNRFHSISSSVNSIADLLSPFNATCQTDLNGQNGPQAFDFLCKPA